MTRPQTNVGYCLEEECIRPAKKRGYCASCYNRLWWSGELQVKRKYLDGKPKSTRAAQMKRDGRGNRKGSWKNTTSGQSSLEPVSFAPGFEVILSMVEPERTELLLRLRQR